MTKRKIPNLGDIFLAPLKDGSSGVGQIVHLTESMNLALCVFYSYRNYPGQADAPWPLAKSDVIAIQFVPHIVMRTKEWPIVGNLTHANCDLVTVDLEVLRRSGYVGLKFINPNAAEALLNAYHGLGPWESGTDGDFLRRMLLKREPHLKGAARADC
jgi:hypothetical protein